MKPVPCILGLVLMVTLGACTHTPTKALHVHSPRATTPAPADTATMDSRYDIVLAVANPITPPPPHAASNLLGYASGAGQYRNGQRAVSALAQLKQRYGLHEISAWPIQPLGLYCAVLRPAPGTDRAALLKALAHDQRVRLAEPLHRYAVYTQRAQKPRHNDPYIDLQHGIAATGVTRAHRLSQGRGVDIAIVDTGVDIAHPDLKGRIRAVHNMVGDNPAAFRSDRHGTEVAGIIAADAGNHLGIIGIAPEATLSIYKACWYPSDARGIARCNTFTLAKALSSLLGTDTRIVNLSLGGPADPLLKQLLDTLLNQDRIVVAAMPPVGHVQGFPSTIPGVIVVRTGQASPAAAGILSAPGIDILTTQPNGRYDFSSGSSMAAAHVSGIAALLLSLSPQLDAHTLRTLLQRSSQIHDGKVLVNAASAVTELAGARRAGTTRVSSP